jgi:hypothetical protein
MPWSIIFDFSTSCTFTELYNSIKNGQSAPDGWTFPEKYDKCSVSATIGRSKVENDPVVMSCNVAQAVAAFGRYISFKLFDKFFEKRKKTSEKKEPPSLIHFLQNWPENLGIFFVWP